MEIDKIKIEGTSEGIKFFIDDFVHVAAYPSVSHFGLLIRYIVNDGLNSLTNSDNRILTFNSLKEAIEYGQNYLVTKNDRRKK